MAGAAGGKWMHEAEDRATWRFLRKSISGQILDWLMMIEAAWPNIVNKNEPNFKQ